MSDETPDNETPGTFKTMMSLAGLSITAGLLLMWLIPEEVRETPDKLLPTLEGVSRSLYDKLNSGLDQVERDDILRAQSSFEWLSFGYRLGYNWAMAIGVGLISGIIIVPNFFPKKFAALFYLLLSLCGVLSGFGLAHGTSGMLSSGFWRAYAPILQSLSGISTAFFVSSAVFFLCCLVCLWVSKENWITGS